MSSLTAASGRGSDGDRDPVRPVVDVNVPQPTAQQAAHQHQQGAASPSPAASPASGPVKAVASSSGRAVEVQSEAQLLTTLQAYVTDKGACLEDGWKVEKRRRSGGTTAGQWDAYYFSPSGKKYRSRAEVGKALGIEAPREKKEKKPKEKPPEPPEDAPMPQAVTQEMRQDALVRARDSAAALGGNLPLDLGWGVSLTSLGQVDPRPGYHTERALFPIGLTSRFVSSSGGVIFESRIADGGSQGPVFLVKLNAPDLAASVQLACERSADSAWAAVAQLQHSLLTQQQAATTQQQQQGVQLPNGTSHSNAESYLHEAESSALAGLEPGARSALASAEKLGGSWGPQLFSLADAGVLMRLEALPGVEKCDMYCPTEYRGGWEAVRRGLEREVQRHQKAAKANGTASSDIAVRKRGRPAKDAADKAKPRKKPNTEQAADGKRQLTLMGSLAGSTAHAAGSTVSPQPSSAVLGLGPAAAAGNLVQENGEASGERGRGRGRGRGGRGRGRGRGSTASLPPEEAEVRRALDHIIDHIEKDAEKQARKAERKLQRAAEKETEKAAKAAEREVERERARQAADARAEQMRALSAVDVEDTLLPGADALPPAPRPIGAGSVPPHLTAGVLEVWEFLCQFSEMLGLEEVPSISSLALDLGLSTNSNSSSPEVASSIILTILETLMREAFDSAVDIAAEASADVKPRDLSAAFPPIREGTWQEAARRLAALCQVGRMVQASEGQASGGQDVALGPNVGATPIAALGPSMVLQYLVAGGICAAPSDSSAMLPLGACPSATQSLLARQDARALAEADAKLPASGGQQLQAAAAQQKRAAIITAGRSVLDKLSRLKGPKLPEGQAATCRALTFQGSDAAAAARSAQVIDLMTIGARIEAGVYGNLEDGLAALEDDIRAACDLFKNACKRTGSDFAAALLDAKAVRMADMVWEKLGSIIHQQRGLLQASGAASTPEPATPAATPAPSPAPSGDGEEQQDHRAQTDPVKDLSRPYSPWDGCCICWRNDDRKNILLCDGCDAEFHTYCMQPPLAAIPSGEWYCPACTAELSQQGELPEGLDVLPEAAWRTALQDDFTHTADLLGVREWGSLGQGQQLAAVLMLARLAQESGAARTQLAEADATRREERKQLDDLRKQAKREEKERAEQAQQKITDFPSGQTAPRTRTRAEESQVLATWGRVAALEARVKLRGAQSERLTPLGYDRAWNRFWLLGTLLPASPGMVCVELRGQRGPPQADLDEGSTQSESAVAGGHADSPVGGTHGDSAAGACTWGCYPSAEDVDALIAHLNHQGKREGPLKRALMHFQHQLPKAAAQLPTPQPEAAGTAADRKDDGDSKAEEVAAAGAAAEAGTTEAAAPLQDSPPEAAFTQTLDKGSRIHGLGSAAENGGSAQAQQDDVIMTGAKPDPEAAADAALEAVAAIIDELEAIMSSVADELRPEWGHPERVKRWEQLLGRCSSPQKLMAATLVLESMIPPARLKPWWRLWAFPLPSPSSAGTTAAVLMRVTALKAALKKSSGQAAAAQLHDALESRGRSTRGYAMRERRLAPGAMAEDALEAVHDDSAQDDSSRGGKRERAIRRAEHRASPSPPGENSGLDERARRRLAREGLPMVPSLEQESSPSESPEPLARKLGLPKQRSQTPEAAPTAAAQAGRQRQLPAAAAPAGRQKAWPQQPPSDQEAKRKGDLFRRIVSGRARAQQVQARSDAAQERARLADAMPAELEDDR